MSVITIGKFDGFHLGHRLLLSKLQTLTRNGEQGIVLMIRAEGERILTHEEDLEVLKEYGSPQLMILPFTPELMKMSPEEFVRVYLAEKLHGSAVIVGSDFRFGYQRSGNVETLMSLGEKNGIRVMAVDKLFREGEVVSSSRIRRLLAEGDVRTASRLLDFDICFTGIVQQGKHLGRTLGFPTLNLYPPEEKLLPCFGVYRSHVILEGEDYTGLTNIGLRPTIQDGDRVTVETYLTSYDGDAYGKTVKVVLQDFIRPEMHFQRITELQEQMKKDLKYL